MSRPAGSDANPAAASTTTAAASPNRRAEASARYLAFVPRVLEIGAQYGVHAGLIPASLTFEPIDHIRVETNRQTFLVLRRPEHAGPSDPLFAGSEGVGIVLDRFGDIGIGKLVDPFPVRPRCPKSL